MDAIHTFQQGFGSGWPIFLRKTAFELPEEFLEIVAKNTLGTFLRCTKLTMGNNFFELLTC